MVSSDMNILLIGLIVAVILVCASIGTVAYVLMKAHSKTISPRKAVPHLVGLVWILPVVAVFLFLVVPVFLVFMSYSLHRNVSPSHNVAVVESGRSEDIAPTRLPERISASPTTSTAGPSGTASDVAELPAWVRAGDVEDENRRLVVLESEQFSEVDRARQDVLAEAVRVVREDFQQTHNAGGDWTLPEALVQKHAVKQEHIEPIARRTEQNSFLVYRVYYQVELSPTVREVVFDKWRGQTVNRRLWMLGGLLGFVTLMLGTTATYLRLDAMTNGTYRRRLKLASVSLLVAAGLGLAALLPMS